MHRRYTAYYYVHVREPRKHFFFSVWSRKIATYYVTYVFYVCRWYTNILYRACLHETEYVA